MSRYLASPFSGRGGVVCHLKGKHEFHYRLSSGGRWFLAKKAVCVRASVHACGFECAWVEWSKQIFSETKPCGVQLASHHILLRQV